MRAGLYLRVSEIADGRSRSIEQQNETGRESVKRAGWRAVAEYSEPDRSASRFAKRGRPEWDRLLADVKARRIDVVVLWEPARGSRELEDWARFLNVCRSTGTLIYIVSHNHLYDLSNSREWRSLAEDGVDSAYESDKISARTLRGLVDMLARGVPFGRVPYGFRRVSLPGKDKTQEPDPRCAPIAAEILTRLAKGEPVSAIQADLFRRGIASPSGQPRWPRHSITWLASEGGAVYIGKQRLNGGPLMQGNWPAIVDESVYWRAKAVLGDPERKPKGRGIRPGAVQHMVSYIARCGNCDAPMSMQRRMVKGENVPCYRCSKTRAGCVWAPAEWVDGIVSDRILSWIVGTPGVFEGIMYGNDADAQAAQDEIAAERARLAEFEQMAIAKKIPADSFARIADGIQQNIAALEARAHSAVSPVLRDLVAGGGNRIGTLRAVWNGMPVANRRSVASKLLVSLRLLPADNPTDPARIAAEFVKL